MTEPSAGFRQRLDRIVARGAELRDIASCHEGGDGYREIARELAELEPIVDAVGALRRAELELREAIHLRDDPTSDPELRAMAVAEALVLGPSVEALQRQVGLLLLPRDEADLRNVILEVRAGTGGDEAALFASDLFEMYRRFAEAEGWRFEAMEVSENDLGGLREGIAEIRGPGAFRRLKFESGVHRVQRVPATEAQGRIHTSTATVAVLPEAEEVDLHVDERDLRIDVFRASGAGGQHVNKTESAVRITHLPSGVVVVCQDEKSQHKNKARAMKILRSRLYEADRARKAASRSADRRAQVGTGDRSERIRTYNIPQGRVTDHRIGLSLHKVDRVLAGDLGDVLDALAADDEAARLAEAG